jgi:hypothetical protein
MYGTMGAIHYQEQTEVIGQKLVPVPHRLPQIQQAVAEDCIWCSGVNQGMGIGYCMLRSQG